MPYKMNKPQFDEVVSLTATQRYNHFVSKVTDWQVLWTLKGSDGYVLFGDNEGNECIPVWPHHEYAAALANGEWSDSKPERLELEAFMTNWIPRMIKDNRKLAVFPTPDKKGVVVAPSQLQKDLQRELEQYE